MREILLGLDIGTSACKVAAFSAEGKLLGQQQREYPVLYPKPGWVEQRPEDWWQGVCDALRGLWEQGIDPAAVCGVGIDGQSWSAIAMGPGGEALCPTPIWMDTRAEEICQRLRVEFGEDTFFECSGNPLQPTYSMPKILWYKEHLPEVFAKAQCYLQSNGYIAYRLTGSYSQDVCQGYGYQCFDMRKGRWNKELCRALGIDPALLPEPVPCHQVVGTVTGQAAEQTGLSMGVPVVAGGLDAACGSLGAGVLQPGETQEQGGQAGGMSICMDTYHADPRLILSFHVVPDRWLIQGGTVGGGGVMKWMAQELGAAEGMRAEAEGTNVFYEMDQEAAKIPPGSEGMLFLPYFAGERSPIWDSKAKGVYYGLDYTKTRAHMIRAGMEGVAFALTHNLQAAREAGVEPQVLRAMGGAANSRVWTQIKADVTGKRFVVPAADEATTLGAAMLAGVGVGVWPSFEEAVAGIVVVRREHLPDMENHALYQRAFGRYRKLYESLKELMHEAPEAQSMTRNAERQKGNT